MKIIKKYLFKYHRIIIIIIFFQFEDHGIGKFSNYIINFRKLDFFSEEKISENSRFVNKDAVKKLNNVCYGTAKCIKGNNKGKYNVPLFDD